MSTMAAPIVPQGEEPAYTVSILESATPIATAQPTPKGSTTATPITSPPPEREERPYTEKTLTVSEVATIILRSLVGSAVDFLGKPIDGAVITVPSHFTAQARQTLQKAAETAGIPVLQLLDEAAAVAIAYTSLNPPSTTDTISLILDLGASSLDLSLLAIKQGLVHQLASSHTPGVGGDAMDDKLIAFFVKEFTKKTKIELSPTSRSGADIRALTKLRLAVEHTKRTLSASPGAAACSVESLKEGMDFSGSINPIRFDVEIGSIYNKITTAIRSLLESASLDAVQIDEVLLVGGSTLLPGLTSKLSTIFEESTQIRSDIDPSQVLSRGAAVQAGILASLSPDDPLREAFKEGSSILEAKVTSHPIGIYFPGDPSGGKPTVEKWLPVIASETPLPARRTVSFNVQLPEGEGKKRVGFEIWQVKETVSIEKIKPPVEEDEEEDEELEEIEVRERSIEKDAHLASMELFVDGLKQSKKQKRLPQVKLRVTFIVTLDGVVEVVARAEGAAEPVSLKIGA